MTLPNNTGTPEQQVTFFTQRIIALTSHLKTHPKDKSTKRGLINIVSKRTKMLQYLKKRDLELYKKTCKNLSLRK